MEEAGILPYEMVQVLDVDNGVRLETYAIPAPADSGTVGINGPAARLVHPGDTVLLLTYQTLPEEEARKVQPVVVFVDARNAVTAVERKGPDQGFWHPKTFDELAQEQGVSLVKDWSALSGGWPQDADFESFLRAIRSIRKE
jgi:aspartate 1-decarboxylase